MLGIRNDEIVCYFLDRSGSASSSSYQPNTTQIASAIAGFGQDNNCNDYCFVHSHPEGFGWLSYADTLFARSSLNMNPGRDYVWMALVADDELLIFKLFDINGEIVKEPVTLTCIADI